MKFKSIAAGIWTHKAGDDLTFTITEKQAPFGSYYKLSVSTTDGTYTACNQKSQRAPLERRAKELHAAYTSAGSFDLTKQKEKWSETK